MSPPVFRRAFLRGAADRLQPRDDLAARLRREADGELLPPAQARRLFPHLFAAQPPVAVFAPRTEAALEAAVAVAREAGVPVRAAGTGSAIAEGPADTLLLYLGAHLTGLAGLEHDRVTVQAGLPLHALQRWLAARGLWLPADGARVERGSVGGLLADDAAGPLALAHGGFARRVHAAQVVLPCGTRVRLGAFGEGGDMRMDGRRLAELVPAVFELARGAAPGGTSTLARTLADCIPLDGVPNLAGLLAGAKGTLGVTARLELRVAPRPACERTVTLVAPDAAALPRALPALLALRPDAVAMWSAGVAPVAGLPDSAVLLRCRLPGRDAAEAQARARALGQAAADVGLDRLVSAEVDADAFAGFDALAAASTEPAGPGRAVSLAALPERADRLSRLLATHRLDGGWQGHALPGAVHLQPVVRTVPGRTDALAHLREQLAAMAPPDADAAVRARLAHLFSAR